MLSADDYLKILRILSFGNQGATLNQTAVQRLIHLKLQSYFKRDTGKTDSKGLTNNDYGKILLLLSADNVRLPAVLPVSDIKEYIKHELGAFAD